MSLDDSSLIFHKMPTESQHLEYKSEITDTLEREVVGFLNSREGGRILLGVDDFGTVLGLADPDNKNLKDTHFLEHSEVTWIY